jgi:hypothetical protein
MDITSPFKTEVLRPFTTWVIPGSFAIGPYLIIVSYYAPAVAKFWDTNPSAAIAVITIATLAAGLVLESFGESIETVFWDRILQRKYGDHNEKWEAYLKLRRICLPA